jgi:excisionase family DNA binding protein
MMTTRDVMDRLGVKDPQKVYDLVRDRKLAAVNVGTDRRATWRFEPAAVEAYLTSRRVGPLELPPPKPLPAPMRNTLKRTVVAAHD